MYLLNTNNEICSLECEEKLRSFFNILIVYVFALTIFGFPFVDYLYKRETNVKWHLFNVKAINIPLQK